MNSTLEAAKPATVTPLPDLKLLAGALGNPTRWRMLKELSLAEPRTVGELATAAGCNYDNAGRHLSVLRKAGLVTQGRGDSEASSARARRTHRGLRPLPAPAGRSGLKFFSLSSPNEERAGVRSKISSEFLGHGELV